MGGSHIEVLVRGVCVRDNKVLLCHTNGADNTYLPGGHVDMAEHAREALEREIVEELGCDSRAGLFLGAVEHTFHDGEENIYEVNLVFALDIPSVKAGPPPRSCEEHLDFQWAELTPEDLESAVLEPSVLRELIPRWVLQVPVVDRWGSTY